jgi:hypothetical protein
MGGSTLLGSLGGSDDEEDTPQYTVDPYIAQLRAEYEKRSSPEYYKTEPSPVETATETRLLGRLGTSTDDLAKKFGPEMAKPYYEAAKTRMGEQFGEEENYAKNLLAREGVLTSTPGFKGLTDLKRKQGAELNEFSQKLMYEDLDRELQAQTLAEDILSQAINEGTMFGNLQREYQQWPYEMASNVFRGSSNLGGTAYMPTSSGSSVLSDLGKTGTDIGSLMLMAKLLGKG